MTERTRRVRAFVKPWRIAVALGGVGLLKHALGARRTARLLDAAVAALPPRRLARDKHLAAAHALSREIDAVASCLPRSPRCLTRSLTLSTALRRNGVPAVLQVGVNRDADFSAHAWVEVEGAPIGADGAARSGYVRLWQAE